MRHKNRYKNICESKRAFRQSLRYYRAFDKIKSQSKDWLKTSEFKAKYIDTNHPYPPLLNPDSIDYDSIPAEFAWEMNLPLPPHYELLTIANVCCASLATYEFLKQCNNKPYSGENFLEIYKNIYNSDICRKTIYHKTTISIFFYYQMFFHWDKKNALKFQKIITKKVPLLFLVRCPISQIKTCLNHHNNDYGRAIQYVKNFNLTYKDSVDDLIPKATYLYSNDYKPSYGFLLDNPGNLASIESVLAKDSMLEAFIDNISYVYCVEFNDLKSDKAFDTFSKMAHIFDFDKPKNKDFFANKQWTEIYTLLPTTLYVHPDDLEIENQIFDSLNKRDSIPIIITLPSHLTEKQKDFIDIGSIFESNLTIDETMVLIIIEQEHFLKLKDNDILYNTTIKFLMDYISAIRKELHRRNKDKITEKQILDFLRQNHKVRKTIKNILDNELTYIKTNHPDFIQKWKYYLEFEKMCDELDSG
ncbi:DUF2972 domain-containing protein [Helicobacter sp. T3_23-1056]